MSRENLRIKLLRMVSGQVRSYVNDHPDSIAPFAIATIHNSLAKRIAHELIAKGLVFDPHAIRALRAQERAHEARPAHRTSASYKVEKKKRRSWRH